MPLDTYFAEEYYILSVNKKVYEVYTISFLLNEQYCFRVYVDKGPGNLFTWDEKSGSLQQMDGKPAFENELLKALNEKIAAVMGTSANDTLASAPDSSKK